MEVDLSFSDDGGDDEKNDDQMYRVPSTPRYSESSFKQFIKHPTYVPGREDRVFVVILVSLTFLVQVRTMNNTRYSSGRYYQDGDLSHSICVL
jgi:hypothetical protein